MAESLPTENDLALRLHNFGTAEWIRRNQHNEKLRVALTCVDALDEIQRLRAEIEHLRGYQQQMNGILQENENLRGLLRGIARCSQLAACDLCLQLIAPYRRSA